MGEPRKAAENSSCDIPSRPSASVRALLPAMASRGANSDPSDNARENLWVYGHASWETSQPFLVGLAIVGARDRVAHPA